MRKLIFSLAVILGFLFVSAGSGHAESPIRLFLDGKQLSPLVPPRIENSTTLVPIRVISEELGAKITWTQQERKVTVEKNELVIHLFIDKKEASVNGEISNLDAAPMLVEGTTLLPVRFISERMGLKVEWDGITRSVSLYNQQASTPVFQPNEPTLLPAGATPAPTPTGAPEETDNPAATPGIEDAPGVTPTPGATVVPTTPPAIVELQQISLDNEVLKLVTSIGDTKLSPSFLNLSNPSRLVIDLPYTKLGAFMNGQPTVQNGEILIDHPQISKLRYALFQELPYPIVRIVFDLKGKIEYNLLESLVPGETLISLKARKYIVVLDAGHGGKDPGAISAIKRFEKDFTLAVVLKAAKLLESEVGIEVRLTRQDDATFVELAERAAFANRLGADVFISVHANSVARTTVKGVETYYTREDSKQLATILHRRILSATGSTDRGVRTADFRVTKATVMPAALLEVGYLSNPEEEQELFKPEVQDRVAASIVAGIKEYLQIP